MVMGPHNLLCCLAAAMFALSAVSPAEARRFRVGAGMRAISNATKIYSAETLSPAQLKNCLIDEKRLEKVSSSLGVRREEISGQQTEIRMLRIVLEANKESLDRTSQKEIDAFNRQVVSFNAKVKAGSAATDEYNRSVETQKLENARFNQECGGKRYYEDDLVTARAELGVTD